MRFNGDFMEMEERLIHRVNHLINHRLDNFRREILYECSQNNNYYTEKNYKLSKAAKFLERLISKNFRIELLDKHDLHKYFNGY